MRINETLAFFFIFIYIFISLGFLTLTIHNIHDKKSILFNHTQKKKIQYIHFVTR